MVGQGSDEREEAKLFGDRRLKTCRGGSDKRMKRCCEEDEGRWRKTKLARCGWSQPLLLLWLAADE